MLDIDKCRQRVEVFVWGDNNTILAASKGHSTLPFLPGGGLDNGERIYDAAARELMEEAGWVANNYSSPKMIFQNSIFNGPPDEHLKKEGYVGERSNLVTCNAIRFAPDTRYSSEGDGDVFVLRPVAEVCKETENSLSSLNPRLKAIAMFRLEALTFCIKHSGIKLDTKPAWLTW